MIFSVWYTKGWFTLWTMKSDHGRWCLSMVRVHGTTSMVQLHKKLVLRAMGPSLGVNQMWTKKKDHGAKSGGGDFFNICTKKGSFQKSKLWPFFNRLVFTSFFGFGYIHFEFQQSWLQWRRALGGCGDSSWNPMLLGLQVVVYLLLRVMIVQVGCIMYLPPNQPPKHTKEPNHTYIGNRDDKNQKSNPKSKNFHLLYMNFV